LFSYFDDAKVDVFLKFAKSFCKFLLFFL
jgi:hypothetical protein